MQRAARSPEAPSSCYCCGDCLGPAGDTPALVGEAGSHPPPGSSVKHPTGHASTSTRAPGGSAPGSRTRTSCRPPAPPRSLFPERLLPPRRRRLRLLLPASRLSSSGPRAAEGAAASGCACSRGARLLIPAGGGASARAGLAVAGRGPSHQRWRGAEGRAEQPGWVGSVLRVAMAASTPGRAPPGQGRAAQSRRWPVSAPRPAERPQPCARAGPAASEAGEREVQAVAPLPGPGPAPRQGGAGRRAAGAAGTAGEPQPPPASGPATCAPARPAPRRLGAGAPGGRPPGAPLPAAAGYTSDLCLTWS